MLKLAMTRDNIRILHLITRYQLRGAERFASQLAGSLASRGFSNYICSIYGANPDGFPTYPSVDYLTIGASQAGLAARIGLQPSTLIKTARVFRKIRPDIVFAHGADTMKYGILASRFYPLVPVVYVNIGMASYWAGGRLKTWVNSRLLNQADTIVSVSQASREDFQAVYGLPQNKISIINNAIDSRRYRHLEKSPYRIQIRQKLGLKETDLVAITIGSLSHEKNQGELLTLLYEIEDLSLRLLLIGDGPSRRTLERQADELKIRERVHFVGVEPDVIPYLAASDIFLLPSRSEGMPGVLIEAGMAGLPSVAYDVGGVKEIIEPDVTGIVVPPGDYGRFMAAVISLLAEPSKRREMGIRARSRCLTSFDIDNAAGQYKALISRLLKDKVTP